MHPQNLVIPSLFSGKSWVFCFSSLSVYLLFIYPNGSQRGVILSLRDIWHFGWLWQWGMYVCDVKDVVSQFRCSVVSDSLQPHEPQHARPPCPSPTPGVDPNPCPLSQWCHPTISSSVISPSPPALNLSQHQGLFQWVSSSHKVAKVLEFQLQHQSFQWTPRLISFRIDWLDLLSVQGTLQSLLQHHSSKASILLHSAFFIVQFSHSYMTSGKTIVLTRQTFVGKVLSLLFTMLSRLVITFLPKSKCLLISWLQSPSAVILEPPKIKSVSVSTVSPSICH